ncbi:MAG: hypothetical protein ACE5FL_09150 [Myxococcota bacterium]
MHSRPLVTTLTLALFGAAACQPSAETEVVEPTPIAGMYEVSGTTVESTTGDRREISGSVILAEDGATYTATFHLNTGFPAGDSMLTADVIGKGSGTIDGRELRGVAETQLVISTVPGIDPAFAFIPRTTTTRLVSNSTTTIAANGEVVIEIENEPAEGETYASTRTTLRGRRVSARIADEIAPVSAAAE